YGELASAVDGARAGRHGRRAARSGGADAAVGDDDDAVANRGASAAVDDRRADDRETGRLRVHEHDGEDRSQRREKRLPHGRNGTPGGGISVVPGSIRTYAEVRLKADTWEVKTRL